MNFWDALILGLLQGITEFLPISSSGHLVLGEQFLGLDVANLKSFDVAVHVGTLFAILVYFWSDIVKMLQAFWAFCRGKLKKDDPYGNLIIYVIVGTLPVLIGPFLGDYIDSTFRNITWVATWMVIVGVIFILGEYVAKKRAGSELNWKKALIIGFAQLFALIPGVSRSGSTIVAGLFQGVERAKAARFSFLLGIPALMGAGLITALGDDAGASVPLDIIGIGAVAAFVAGLLSINFLMRFLKKNSLLVFAIYLILLGISVILGMMT